MKITDDFPLQMEAIMCLPQNWHFCSEQDEWDTKKVTGESMKNALHAQRYGKRHLLGWNNVEQWKIYPIALAIVELRESEGIR